MITTHGCPTCRCEPPASWVRREVVGPWRYPTERYSPRLLPAWTAALAAMRSTPDGWAQRAVLVDVMVRASDVKAKTCENQLRAAELACFLGARRGVGGSLWYRIADDGAPVDGVGVAPGPRGADLYALGRDVERRLEADRSLINRLTREETEAFNAWGARLDGLGGDGDPLHPAD